MVTEPRYIDLDDDSELARLADEVRATNAPRFLRRQGVAIATIAPARAPKRRTRHAMTEEERERKFRSSFGGWRDVDTDQLLRDIYTHRHVSPPREFSLDTDADDGDASHRS